MNSERPESAEALCSLEPDTNSVDRLDGSTQFSPQAGAGRAAGGY